jgi:hypothetical protein
MRTLGEYCTTCTPPPTIPGVHYTHEAATQPGMRGMAIAWLDGLAVMVYAARIGATGEIVYLTPSHWGTPGRVDQGSAQLCSCGGGYRLTHATGGVALEWPASGKIYEWPRIPHPPNYSPYYPPAI